MQLATSAMANAEVAEDATAVTSVAPDVGPAVSADEPEEQTAVTSVIAEAEAAETADEGVAHEAAVSPPPAEGADAMPPAAS